MAIEPATRTRARVKGVSFRSMLGALERLRGAQAVTATLALAPEDVREGIRLGSLVSGGWYDLEWYKALHAAARKVTGGGRELPRTLSRDARMHDFRGVYRVFSFLLTPEALLARGASAFKRYYEQGAMRVLDAGPGTASAQFSGCMGFDANIWETIVGGTLGVLEVCGAKDVRARVRSGGQDGDEGMVLEAHWVVSADR